MGLSDNQVPLLKPVIPFQITPAQHQRQIQAKADAEMLTKSKSNHDKEIIGRLQLINKDL